MVQLILDEMAQRERKPIGAVRKGRGRILNQTVTSASVSLEPATAANDEGEPTGLYALLVHRIRYHVERDRCDRYRAHRCAGVRAGAAAMTDTTTISALANKRFAVPNGSQQADRPPCRTPRRPLITTSALAVFEAAVSRAPHVLVRPKPFLLIE